ncbi:DUF4474 domain-containing protein [Anaerosacchariphilus polymeriproducens]|uniref:DUF4474 domain-containing protein n=1 Tax=Anaerosacchariphilus polymeriproducens TaxID=1812858 RepID=A0A371AWW3_9FIRM|nr:DUF4474 domain-containing protein [Anaerosacchariphilus polymeriproducens]RDU24029.1 DUF4474 domain-containing protein [Anaerosacchariphilus polymeriproducens]
MITVKSYIYPGCVIIIVVLLLLLIRLWLQDSRRRRAFYNLLHNKKYSEKVNQLNELLKPYGYMYNTMWDCISSRTDAWQKDFGYSKLYDEMAPFFNMIFDCEPIHFEYDEKLWLVEFWKGQYGLTAGAEVGIYNRKKSTDGIINKNVYKSLNEDDFLPIGMTIWNKENILFEQKKRHWWLANFAVGEFVDPQDLHGEIEIVFPNQEMCMAFLRGVQKAGYEGKQIYIKGYTVFVTFDVPYAKQPRDNKKFLVRLKQKENKKNCKIYNRITKDYDSTLDKILYLTMEYPLLFDVTMKIGKTREIFKLLD